MTTLFESDAQNEALDKNPKPPDEFSDAETIMDSLYGLIQISPFEKELICTPELQRLRRIKQLGFVNLVFPTAEHSRFVHSIGVCHKSKELMLQINHNLLHDKRYQSWREHGLNNKKSTMGLEHLLITPVEKIVISAAALLHDLPHSPFSHEIESPSGAKDEIPVHDEFDANPVLFRYLFDTKHSKLAELIEFYNKKFWIYLQKDTKWRDKLPIDIIKDGMIEIPIAERGKSDEFEKKIKSYPILREGNFNLERLPLLGVMIFEIHLFDKPECWAIKTKKGFKNNYEPRTVATNWELDNDGKSNDSLYWRPLYNWFRPYRKDIITNTICADLMDYVVRDGIQTGIISSLDLKFLDRMTIARAVYFKNQQIGKVENHKLPETFEHVVFDIFDHKRNILRDSVITEILSCLQARYLLSERVYGHRVVEGARSMLQEVSRLLSASKVLSIKDLHTCNSGNIQNPPIGDESFLSWVIDLSKSEEFKKLDKKDPLQQQKHREILAATELAKHIRDRRIYRESVIIDGIHGFENRHGKESEDVCGELADCLLPTEIEVITELKKTIDNITGILRQEYKKLGNNPTDLPEILVTIGVRKYGKRHKIPTVLIAIPNSTPDRNGEVHLKIKPLFAFLTNPPYIRDRLQALKAAYDNLWRVYLFVHPAFHSTAYKDIYKKIEGEFLQYIDQETGTKWRNSLNNIEQLLPKIPIDQFQFLLDIKKPQTNNEQNFSRIWVEKVLNEVFSKISHPEIKRYQKKAKSGITVAPDIVDKLINGYFLSYKEILNSNKQEEILNKIVNWNPKELRSLEGSFISIDSLIDLIGKKIIELLTSSE